MLANPRWSAQLPVFKQSNLSCCANGVPVYRSPYAAPQPKGNRTSTDGEATDQRPGARRGGRPGERPVLRRRARARVGTLRARPAPDRRITNPGR